MRTHTASYVAVMVVGLAAFSTVPRTRTPVHQPPEPAARSDGDTIGGVVTGPLGPEAGVWGIAETSELATTFVKIVVTDDQGRYLLPDLPKATYRVWVRGYGLVDSPAAHAAPGKTLNLTAVVAPDARAAAHYYPAGYWFSLIRVPAKSEFGPTGADGNGGASPNVRSQAEWIRILKSGGCWACHQLGSLGTREIPKTLGTFESSTAAWLRRLQSGQAGGQMIGTLSQLGAKRALTMFADWTDRIAAGAVPPTPPRPQGIERNVVITEWDWADPKAYLHDEVSTDPSAKLFPLTRAGRHLAVYDPKTQKLTHISTCFSTHHLMFAEDANRTLWTSGGGPVVGWLNTKLFDETGDEEKSQGWTALILDANGNGKRDAYVEPDQPVDPAKDKRIGGGLYAVAPAPDGSVWGTVLGFPGAVIRLVPGSNPPETALAELYELPLDRSGVPVAGFSPRGGDVDLNGVYWTALASGHLASFDRRKCKGPLNGPSATGQHCAEGWTFYPEPLPQLQGVTDPGSAEASYYTWVDQVGVLGLGQNVPINTGNGSEGLLVFQDGKCVVLRVPYPLGFYTKWMDGRIDDPNLGRT